MSPLPSPSPKWLQLSGPQIGTAGTGLARCPPPSRVCLQERKPAHLWNPSLSPRSASPTCPPGAWGQPPCSVSLFPGPSPITMRAVFSVAQLPRHQTPSCLRTHGLPVPPPPLLGCLISVKVLMAHCCPGFTCRTDPTEVSRKDANPWSPCQREAASSFGCPKSQPAKGPSKGWGPGSSHLPSLRQTAPSLHQDFTFLPSPAGLSWRGWAHCVVCCQHLHI
jgi:hypothetical protein